MLYTVCGSTNQGRHSSPRAAKVAIFYPADPLGHVPGGIDSVIRGILKWAPPDLSYTLFGATSDPDARPLGKEIVGTLGSREFRYIPIVSVDPTGSRKLWPLTARYMWALWKCSRSGKLSDFNVLDFHRIEPTALFMHDKRPKNVILHQDMAVLRDAKSDIMWRHAPWLYEAIESRLLRLVDRVFCVRQSAVQRYKASSQPLAEKFHFIPTWVDTGIFSMPEPASESREQLRKATLKDLGFIEPRKLLISVGRLDHQKDPLLLLQAFQIVLQSHPEMHLILVGDGILRSKVETVCASGDLKHRVSILGARPPAEIARLLQASELFVLASAYEGMPIAVLEALASGLPVVSTDVGEVRLVVHEGVSGRIAPQRSAQAFARAICQALAEIGALRGAPCRQAVEPFRPELVLARIYENHRRQINSDA